MLLQSLGPIRVQVSRRVIGQFKRAAKEAFPRETWAYLLGEDAVDLVVAEGLYFPRDVEKHCTTRNTHIQPHWDAEAADVARDEGLTVVGTIHSHPYTYRECGGSIRDGAPSEKDHLCGWSGIYGICVVAEQRSGRLISRIQFFPPAPVIQTEVISGTD